MTKKKGRRLVGSAIKRAIDSLRVELHLSGYRFCGRGTRLRDRLARGDRDINELDEACRKHNMTYSQFKDNERRPVANRELIDKAWKRVKAWNSGISKRAYAAAVAAIMKAKSALGGSGKKKKKKKKTTSYKRLKTRTGERRRRKTTRRSTATKKASGLYLRLYLKTKSHTGSPVVRTRFTRVYQIVKNSIL